MKFIAKVSEWKQSRRTEMAYVDLRENDGLYPKAGNVLRLFFDPCKKQKLIDGKSTDVTLTVFGFNDIGPAIMVQVRAAHPDLWPDNDCNDQVFYMPKTTKREDIGDTIIATIQF